MRPLSQHARSTRTRRMNVSHSHWLCYYNDVVANYWALRNCAPECRLRPASCGFHSKPVAVRGGGGAMVVAMTTTVRPIGWRCPDVTSGHHVRAISCHRISLARANRGGPNGINSISSQIKNVKNTRLCVDNKRGRNAIDGRARCIDGESFFGVLLRLVLLLLLMLSCKVQSKRTRVPLKTACGETRIKTR